MRIHVVHDHNGKILAAVAVEENAQATSKHKLGGILRPIPGAGQAAADLDVPSEYHHLTLAHLCQELKVDHTSKVPKLTPVEVTTEPFDSPVS